MGHANTGEAKRNDTEEAKRLFWVTGLPEAYVVGKREERKRQRSGQPGGRRKQRAEGAMISPPLHIVSLGDAMHKRPQGWCSGKRHTKRRIRSSPY